MPPSIIEQVQGILFEDVEFGQQLEKWCTDRCSDFEGDDAAEHKLEWTALHAEFCSLFEKKITGFLEEQGYSVPEFWEKLQKAADGEDANLQSEAFLVQALVAWVAVAGLGQGGTGLGRITAKAVSLGQGRPKLGNPVIEVGLLGGHHMIGQAAEVGVGVRSVPGGIDRAVFM